MHGYRDVGWKCAGKQDVEHGATERDEASLNVVILEIGCGTSASRLRWDSEALGLDFGPHCTAVRVNKEEPAGA